LLGLDEAGSQINLMGRCYGLGRSAPQAGAWRIADLYDGCMIDQGSGPEIDTSLEAQRRQQLMRATMECVAEFGVEKTTMWMVAERAGVSTGMVLYYYHNKKELITSAVKLASRDFAERLFAVTHGAWGLARLSKSIEIILSDSSAVPRNFLIQYRMAALNDPEVRRSSLDQVRVSREALSNSVRAAQEEGDLRADVDESLLADLVYALANGLAAEVAAHPEAMSPERASRIAQMALSAFTTGNASVNEPRDDGRPLHGRDVPAFDADLPGESTADRIRALLLRDPNLSKRTAAELAGAFSNMYEISLRERADRPDVNEA
jgi:AcrR family transcriptional regulator